MRTIFSCRCLVVLVWAHLCWKFSEGAVFPCSKNYTQFGNRTLEAGMGGTVSFTFCAKNSVRVFDRITISHPKHSHVWYPQPVYVKETLQVHVETHHHEARVTVSVTRLHPADFNEPFYVTLFAADENGTRINDTSTFFFVIEETGNDTTVRTSPSALVTTAAENTTQFLTDLRNTTVECDEQSDVRPRLAMCRVTDDVCMTVFIGNRNLSPKDQCAAENASHIADFNNIDILKPCLTDLLSWSNVKVVSLDETRYIEIQNWTEVRPQWPYRVACLIAEQQLADPVITWFTLQLWDDQRETILWEHNLLDRNNTSVVIPATNTTLNVTCRASGYPQPEIVIRRDNETLEVLPDGITFQLNHTFYGEFTCQATNVLTSRQSHIRVLVSATDEYVKITDSTSGNSSQSQTAVWMIGVTAGVLVVTPTIVIVVLVSVYCKKKERRFDTDDFQECDDEGYFYQAQVDVIVVVVDNMALYNLSNNKAVCDDTNVYSKARISGEVVVVDNMALYNLGKNEVTVDNSVLYNMDKNSIVTVDNSVLYNMDKNSIVTVDNSVRYHMDTKSIDETDSVNPYEDINESTRNYEDTTIAKSPQKELGEYSKSPACPAESPETTDQAKVDPIYSVAIKVGKPAAAEAIYSKASTKRVTNLAYENVSIHDI